MSECYSPPPFNVLIFSKLIGDGRNWLFWTGTYSVSAPLMSQMFDVMNETLYNFNVPEGVTWSIAFEPLPTAITKYGKEKGGNSLGTSPADGNAFSKIYSSHSSQYILSIVFLIRPLTIEPQSSSYPLFGPLQHPMKRSQRSHAGWEVRSTPWHSPWGFYIDLSTLITQIPRKIQLQATGLKMWQGLEQRVGSMTRVVFSKSRFREASNSRNSSHKVYRLWVRYCRAAMLVQKVE